MIELQPQTEDPCKISNIYSDRVNIKNVPHPYSGGANVYIHISRSQVLPYETSQIPKEPIGKY